MCVCSSPAILSQCQALMTTALGIVTYLVKAWDMTDALLGSLNSSRPTSSTATYRVLSLLQTKRFDICARTSRKENISMQIFFRGTIPTTEWTNTGYAPTPTSRQSTPARQCLCISFVTNHSAQARIASCRPILPESWDVNIPEQAITIPSKQEGHITFSIPIPPHANGAQRIVIPLDITYDGRSLGQFREAIFVFSPEA